MASACEIFDQPQALTARDGVETECQYVGNCIAMAFLASLGPVVQTQTMTCNRRDLLYIIIAMALPRFSMGILIFLLLLGYGVIAAAVYFHQDAMIFFPAAQSAEEGDRLATRNGFESWRNAQGVQIGWQSLGGDPTNALLVVHGNAGNALHRTYYHQYSRQAGKWKTYLLEYPGYGVRTGQPTEASLTAAAMEAVDVLAELPDRKIWMLGESLGSGVAAAAASSRKDVVSGLILVTPFDSLVSAARSHYPWLPVTALLRTRFESNKHLAGYPGPAAFVVAEKDTVVPPALGQKLYDDYPGRKQLWVAPGSGHDVSTFLATDWPLIVNFLTGA